MHSHVKEASSEVHVLVGQQHWLAAVQAMGLVHESQSGSRV
jgi:hypothetical protein